MNFKGYSLRPADMVHSDRMVCIESKYLPEVRAFGVFRGKLQVFKRKSVYALRLTISEVLYVFEVTYETYVFMFPQTHNTVSKL
jgi:hypothetical protein